MRFEKAGKYYSIIIVIVVSLITLLNLVVFLYGTSFKDVNYSVKSVSAAKMLINTDKIEYFSGETVEIKIINSADRVIVEQKKAPIIANYERNLGKNFGVGVIEKYVNNSWLVVEAIWRCNSSCYEECIYGDYIKPTESKTFNWNQKLTICDMLNHNEETLDTGAGKYRVSVAMYDDSKRKHIIFHSNEFIIN